MPVTASWRNGHASFGPPNTIVKEFRKRRQHQEADSLVQRLVLRRRDTGAADTPSGQQIRDDNNIEIGKRRERTKHLGIERMGSEHFDEAVVMTYANTWNCLSPPRSQHPISVEAMAQARLSTAFTRSNYSEVEPNSRWRRQPVRCTLRIALARKSAHPECLLRPGHRKVGDVLYQAESRSRESVQGAGDAPALLNIPTRGARGAHTVGGGVIDVEGDSVSRFAEPTCR